MRRRGLRYAVLMLAFVLGCFAGAIEVLHFLGLRDQLIDDRGERLLKFSQVIDWAYNGTKPTDAPEQKLAGTVGEHPAVQIRPEALVWAACEGVYQGARARIFDVNGNEILDCSTHIIMDDFGIAPSQRNKNYLQVVTAIVIDRLYPEKLAPFRQKDYVAAALKGLHSGTLERQDDGRLTFYVISPWTDGKSVVGAILLIADFTDVDERWRDAVLTIFAAAVILLAISWCSSRIAIRRPSN